VRVVAAAAVIAAPYPRPRHSLRVETISTATTLSVTNAAEVATGRSPSYATYSVHPESSSGSPNSRARDPKGANSTVG